MAALTGHVSVITGGNGGIGLGLATGIAKAGGDIMIWGHEAYGTSKTAVLGLVRAMAVGLARYQIRVNALIPGWTTTDLTTGAAQNEKFMAATTRRTPVRRWGTPEDFVEIGPFLANPELVYHTGQEVVVDGGYTVF